MANIDVTITSPSATKSKVDVSSVTVSKNDTITWINDTSDEVRLFMPHNKVANSQNHFFRTIQPGESEPIKITTSKLGKYRYGVFCLDTNSFATGSDLEIIVV
jgi:plastocyanin